MIDLVKELDAWAGLLSFVCSILIAIGMLYLKTIFVTRPALEKEKDEREKAISKHGDRLTTIERTIGVLERNGADTPTQGDLQKFLVVVESIRGDVKAMAAEVSGLDRGVSQIGRKVDMLVENEIKGAQNSKGSGS